MKRNAHRKTEVPEAAFGLKAHSGWAALVILGRHAGELQVLERTRLSLVDESWAKQPYHSAEDLEPAEARALVKLGIAAAKRGTVREMRAAVERTSENGFVSRYCGVLMGSPMPDWSVAEILAVHFRMHKAEGVLFREVLAEAARACDLKLTRVPEKSLLECATTKLETTAGKLAQQIAVFGKSAGAPWGKDQKDAALAALIAFSAK